MAYIDDLTTARDNLAAHLATITVSPKPNYTIEGQTVSHADAMRTWTEQIRALDALITEAEGPDEILTEGYVLPAVNQRSRP